MGEGVKRLTPVMYRNTAPIDPSQSVFKQIVELRRAANQAKQQRKSSELGRLDLGLKLFANSGAYGIFAEINVEPSDSKKSRAGHVFSDTAYACDDVHNERPGTFANFPIASLVTGAARLLLAMLEAEVTAAGGTFAFCDTDSLAIVCGTNCPKDIPCLRPRQVRALLAKFDQLSPYSSGSIATLLKNEYPSEKDLRCFAISAKRYVLYTMTETGRIRIVKPSESALGAIVGRKDRETTKKLARRIWLSILSQERPMPEAQRRRVELLCNFGNIPLRRKLPVTQPPTFARFSHYNLRKDYAQSVKPFNFVQAFTVLEQSQHEDIRPVMPFEKDLGEMSKVTLHRRADGRSHCHRLGPKWVGGSGERIIASRIR